METTNQYLDKYPIPKESVKLIVGTIHPHNHENFKIQFFYGNKNSIWNILSDAFPNDLKKPIELKEVEHFLRKRKIAVSDTIRKCKRKNSSALDQDLIPLELNYQLITDIENSNINEILFTSSFAFKLFYIDILGFKKTPLEVKEKREIILTEKFSRPIKITILYSPSGSANIGLLKTKLYLENHSKYVGCKSPINAFKIDYYREKFSDNKL